MKLIFDLASILPLNIVRELTVDRTALKRDLRTIPVDSLNELYKCPEIPAFEDLHSYLVFDQSNELVSDIFCHPCK